MTDSCENTYKMCKLILNFTHEELLRQFIENRGECEEATFVLLKCISSGQMLASNQITADFQYRFIMSYIVFRFSEYLKNSKIECLIDLRDILFDDNTAQLIPASVIGEFKKACLKTMAFLAKTKPNDNLVDEFKQFICDQNLIGDNLDSYVNYSEANLFKDVYEIVKNERCLQEKPTSRILDQYFDGNTYKSEENTETEVKCVMRENVVEAADVKMNENEAGVLLDEDNATSSRCFGAKDKHNEVRQREVKTRSANMDSLSESETAAVGTQKQTKKLKGKRNRWDDVEILYLVYGVEVHGKGAWSEINADFKDKFKSRSNVDLKDKYRNLERHDSDLQSYKKQVATLKQKLHEQRLSLKPQISS